VTRLPAEVEVLIRAEQARRGDEFIDARVALDDFLAKLGERAELLVLQEGTRCRGVVAFYCNDTARRFAYVTLVVVDPQDRGQGIGEALVAGVLALARKRGFATCRLEVRNDNLAARALYSTLGFQLVEDRGDRALLEVAL
jgi:ribosomal protein S18 acetylase RimI-like enzyme